MLSLTLIQLRYAKLLQDQSIKSFAMHQDLFQNLLKCSLHFSRKHSARLDLQNTWQHFCITRSSYYENCIVWHTTTFHYKFNASYEKNESLWLTWTIAEQEDLTPVFNNVFSTLRFTDTCTIQIPSVGCDYQTQNHIGLMFEVSSLLRLSSRQYTYQPDIVFVPAYLNSGMKAAQMQLLGNTLLTSKVFVLSNQTKEIALVCLGCTELGNGLPEESIYITVIQINIIKSPAIHSLETEWYKANFNVSSQNVDTTCPYLSNKYRYYLSLYIWA